MYVHYLYVHFSYVSSSYYSTTSEPTCLHNLVCVQSPRSTRSTSVDTISQPITYLPHLLKSQTVLFDTQPLAFGINFLIHPYPYLSLSLSHHHAYVKSPLSPSVTPFFTLDLKLSSSASHFHTDSSIDN